MEVDSFKEGKRFAKNNESNIRNNYDIACFGNNHNNLDGEYI